ncbi:amino acid ABC transporter substrate-binding protein [Oharaeibacter diazotrophicus]|uniref:Amino acid ABC transporter substrate-binding protein (PAAT family) n=1 Tax=Oharaeibacter diazotrophicus TaxID=1920512 RepID=A0A4R6RL13_9HYPH|nr:amino acid ABC transporter substrate-binding protein [Oharaeibacter diazotrophicus]TDP87172.1 amino acid ABC transporter substrate-binding protein (PAAT family) [Oharaeibacter diazotrophicus]BBE70885.1 glutamate/aspartate periplasmic-binding protein precursor [Pleomorphomonas sp. SM30]GLS77634.1 amino acid ABC transporter substrate-binding protein [Oharaeibacter diazotrophicus]
MTTAGSWILGALLAAVTGGAAAAGTLERVAETGVIRAGTRADAVPFAFRRDDGGFQGFSVDLIEEIRKAVEAKLGRPVRTEIAAVTPADRIQRVAGGELDVVCEITTPTWDREAKVDFSIPFFRDGTRVLAFRDTLKTTPDVKDMTVAVAEGTTTAAILERALPGVATRAYPSMDAAFAALRAGEVQGVANIGIILLGLARKLEPDRSVVLLPRTEPLGNEAMACVLPQDDSAWRDFVDATIVGLTRGLGDYRGRYVEIYDRWFGRDGVLVYPLDRSTRDYLLQADIWAR